MRNRQNLLRNKSLTFWGHLNIAGVTVRYSDGSTKEIQSGCCVDLEKGSDDLSVEMLNVKPFDLVRLAYGLVAAVQRLGMRDKLEQYANGAGEGQDNG